MNTSRSVGGVGNSISRISGTLSRWFPRPQILAPRSAGVDISDASIKWIVLEEARGGKRVRSYGQEALSPGAVESGLVQDVDALAAGLIEMKTKLNGVDCAHAALDRKSTRLNS